MKELDAHKKEEIAVHAQKEIEQQRLWTGRLKPQGGQKIWQFDLKTKMLSEVTEFEESVVDFKTKQVKKTIVKKPYHLYDVAINTKNAMRKFNNQCKIIFENIQNQKRADK